MTGILLVLITIFLVAILFLSLVLWPVFPDWFGVFGYKRNTPIGKRMLKFIMLFQLMAVVSLYISWSSDSNSSMRFMVFLPAIFIIVLWFYRPDKNRRCFDTKENNLKFYLDGLSAQLQRLDRVVKNENKLVLSFFCLAPNETLVNDIRSAIEPDCQYVRDFVSGGYAVNKVTFLEGFTQTISPVDESALNTKLSKIINTVWDAGGEFAGWDLVTQKRVDDRVELDQAQRQKTN